MPRDAKFGLVVGVGIVLSVAMVFFRKTPQGQSPEPIPAAVTSAPVAQAARTEARQTATPPVAASFPAPEAPPATAHTAEPPIVATPQPPAGLPPCFA
jgi:hypothetical protein